MHTCNLLEQLARLLLGSRRAEAVGADCSCQRQAQGLLECLLHN